MKRALRWLGISLLLLLAVAGAGLAYVAAAPPRRYAVPRIDLRVEVTPERVARGRRIAGMICVSCHLDPGAGALTGRRMHDLPARFGEAWSTNITSHPVKGIGAWSDGEIAYLLRTGVARDGRYTPPWMVKLPGASDEDVQDIIAFLRSDDPLVRPRDVESPPSRPSLLTKALTRVAFGPLPYPALPVAAPPPTDEVGHGRYLATALYQCHGCHSADFATVDDLRPERSKGFFGGGNPVGGAGEVVLSANLTPDVDTGIGGWTEAQFRRALLEGIRPDNRPLRYPMAPYRGLTDAEASAIFAFLRSVPPIRNEVPRATPSAAAGDPGRRAYYAHGCNGCHGESGSGQWDLRNGSARYPTDAELIAFIRHPERFRPGIAMPTWDGVIREEEYGPLAAYVRALAARDASAR